MKKLTTVAHQVKKDKYSQEKMNKLRKNLEKNLSNANQLDDLRENVLINFFKLTLNYIQQNYEKENVISRSASEVSVKTASTISSLKKSTLSTVEDEEPEKKCSMKTAGDVKKRIQWDEMINKDFITVGYIDRFVGLKECQFNMFDWGDIVLADINALAIPEHRIQYFKYKNEIIWNKETRFDNVFGSTGSNTTVYDVIERLKDVSYSSTMKNDNELNIHDADDDEEEKKFNNKNNQITPNYFISIPITDASLKENLFNLRCDLIDSNEQVEHFLLPEQSYHLTLFTLRIENDEELDTIRNLFDVIKNDQDIMNNFPIKLSFQGLDEFFNKVLHVKCNSEQMNRLENLRDVLVKKIKMVGVNSEAGNYYSFVPHLTLFKITKTNINTMKAACSSNNHLKKLTQPCVNTLVNQHIMKKYSDFNFGQQNLNELHLSKMVNIYDMKKYPVEYQLKLNEN